MTTPTITSIADVIGALSNPYPPIHLNKHYKGITLNQRGQIVSINPDSVTVKETQRWPLPSLEGKIYIRSEVFTGAISATIQPVDYALGIYQLSDLTYGDWHERQAERVQPRCPTYITIYFSHNTYRAFLDDISAAGMGILMDKTIDPNGSLKVGAKLSLDLELGSKRLFFHLKGKIVHRQIVGHQLIKFGLQLFPTLDQKKALNHYSIQRRHEILEEMELDLFSMHEPRRVENLYF